MFVPALARPVGTAWDKNRLFCPFLFRTVRVRAEHCGTNIGVFRGRVPRLHHFDTKIRQKPYQLRQVSLARVAQPGAFIGAFDDLEAKHAKDLINDSRQSGAAFW